MERKHAYELGLVNGLPPGTATVRQLYDEPRQPRRIPIAGRTVPELPPKYERKGRWICKYLDSVSSSFIEKGMV